MTYIPCQTFWRR